MTKKAEQDAFYSAELMSRFVPERSEEHTSELQSQSTISYAVFSLKKKKKNKKKKKWLWFFMIIKRKEVKGVI